MEMETDSPIPSRPHTPPLRSPKQRIVFFACAASMIVLAILLNEIYLPHQGFEGSKAIEIPSGFGSRMIADKLKHEGFIRSKWIFEFYVTIRNQASSLKPGDYVFDNASIQSITQELVKGANPGGPVKGQHDDRAPCRIKQVVVGI